jgi:hypothetical protein
VNRVAVLIRVDDAPAMRRPLRYVMGRRRACGIRAPLSQLRLGLRELHVHFPEREPGLARTWAAMQGVHAMAERKNSGTGNRSGNSGGNTGRQSGGNSGGNVGGNAGKRGSSSGGRQSDDTSSGPGAKRGGGSKSRK